MAKEELPVSLFDISSNEDPSIVKETCGALINLTVNSSDVFEFVDDYIRNYQIQTNAKVIQKYWRMFCEKSKAVNRSIHNLAATKIQIIWRKYERLCKTKRELTDNLKERCEIWKKDVQIPFLKKWESTNGLKTAGDQIIVFILANPSLVCLLLPPPSTLFFL